METMGKNEEGFCEKVPGSHRMFRDLSMIHRYTKIIMRQELKKINIERCRPPYLICVYYNEGMTQEMLANMMKIDKGTVAKAISQMEKENLIERRPDLQDKRSYNLYLTQNGRKVIPELFAVEEGIERTATRGMEPGEVVEFKKLLSKASGNILEYMRRGV